ncbi:hypothetical protein CW751_00720 [Brumimicrobium salinarum]|uniref:DUF4271 domain-containing protein n=1 Tax=Brumimicrobium salinarum TaxID=2058658 RepID=A0A2I0R5N2_9FLAO|nr:DUF4271 domain-containing protein [Brumimicrobium salinarum]PKR81892.1 hypothetical protein CW751_00720 [Brumimicrobium salinarum]
MNEYELIFRNEMFPNWIIYVLVFTLVILAILKYQKEDAFHNIRLAFFNSFSSVPFSKKELRFFGTTNWVLLLNYFLTSAIAVYMILSYKENQHFILMLLPIAYYFLQLFVLFFTGLISGELKRLYNNIFLINYIAHVIGLLLIPVLLIWILNPNLSETVFKSILFIFVLLSIIRVFRGILIAIRNKVVWYYIILYLCGLEIWPVVVMYHLLSPNFID